MKRKDNRKSRGVAFILFLKPEDAQECVKSVNNSIMFDRTIKCSIASDNGRTKDFIKRKEYLDKSSCYECGEKGHLSYKCPINTLGDRQPPPKKSRKRKNETRKLEINKSKEMFEDSDDETLSKAILYEQRKREQEIDSLESSLLNETCSKKVKKFTKDTYLSDEEYISDSA
ncbi:zinc finger CCHC-type and RNA-binding motif-containing protein 1-like isoform X2 [Ctenocephalides felis]|nr:zinc finger CCHC-type and RNA-binding motif-containing protein 1-like isoform X2 [Ctenocephalides felis]XP_026478808.1 zinc finger CCHC-type and RNA-binding motif-containing protein 1-like isoform X2 [Ctenocephalides felis]